MIYSDLNSFERRNLYLECEAKHIQFEKKRIRTQKWICRRHRRILTPVEDAWCGDLCCLKCPVGNRDGDDGDNDCNYKFVSTKVKAVLVYFTGNTPPSTIGLFENKRILLIED